MFFINILKEVKKCNFEWGSLCEHAKSAKLDVLAVLSIFNYGFSLAKENFESYSLKNESLCNLSELLEYARESSILNEKEVQTVLSWANEYR